jgi:hypothetical protein
MAETRTINLEIKDNVKSLKTQYREAIQEVQRLADTYGNTSKEAAEAAKRAAELKDRIEESKSLTDAFNPDAKFNALSGSIGGVLNGFQAYEGALGLIGSESEDLQKILLKVQSAMALSQGIQGALEAKDAFVNLTSVVKNAFSGMTKASKLFAVTGIGLLITGVGLLIANFDKVVAFIQPIIDKVKELSDFLGISDFAGEERAKNEKKRNEEEAKQLERLRKQKETAFNNEQKAIDRLIALRQAEGKDVTALTEAKIKSSIAYQKELLKEAELALEVVRQEQYRLKRLGVDTDTALSEQEAKIEELRNSIMDSENQIKVNALQNSKERSDANKDLLKQIKDEQIKQIADQKTRELAALAENLKRQKQDVQNTKASQKQKGVLINELTETYEIERLAILKKYADEEEARRRKISDERVSLTAKTIADITKKEEKGRNYLFDLQTEAFKKQLELDQKEKERIKKLNEYRLKSVQDTLQIISNLSELFAGKNEKQQKRAFQIQKAVNIANAVIDTYKAANTALASSPPPFNYIAMAATITAGLVNVKKIASQQFQSSSSSNGGGGTPSAPEATQATPQFNTIGSSGINQLAQLQQQPVQAYVVSGEVTSAQALDRNRIQNATL